MPLSAGPCPPGAGAPSDRRRGAALLVVLWLAVAAAGLALALLETSRETLPESRRAVDAVRLRAALRAAVHLTAERLLAERLELGPEGGSLRFEFDGVAVRVRVLGESGLVDPAAASPGLLRALARASGLADEPARSLVERIERLRAGRREEGPAEAVGAIRGAGDVLRPPARPGLDHPAELPAVLAGSADPAVLERWLAVTALGTGRGEPAPELAPPLVRAALAGLAAEAREARVEGPRERPAEAPGAVAAAENRPAGRRADPAGLYRLQIVASTAGGRQAVRAVRLALRRGEARPVRIVDWSAPLVLAEGSALEEGS